MYAVFLQLLASFLGALGFSFIFNVEKKFLLFCSFGGILVWSAYLIASLSFRWDDLLSAAFSAAVCQLFGETMARILKAPTTTFCIPALVPLIPGGSLYRTMDAAISRDLSAFKAYGGATLKIAFGIAIGLSFASAFFLIFKKIAKKSNNF